MQLSLRWSSGLLLLSLVAGLAAVSPRSLWIDEANTALIVRQPTVAAAWQQAWQASGSTLQMPAHLGLLFAWEKVLGHSELALRWFNLPFFLLGQLAFLVLLRDRPRLAVAACLLAAVNPFVWAYLDEARPYMMQYGAACWLAASLAAWSLGPPGKDRVVTPLQTAWLMAMVFLVCGASLLGYAWSGSFLLAAGLLLRWGGTVRLHRPAAVAAALVVGLAALGLLLVYYLWTFAAGARASSVGSTGWINLVFVAYELLGFAGLGPGRPELRAAPIPALIKHLPALLVAAGITGGFFSAFVWMVWRRRPSTVVVAAWVLAAGLPLIFLVGLGMVGEFRVLGRHFTPALPMVVLAAAWTCARLWSPGSWKLRAAACLLPALWLTSSWSFRSLPRHAKDDYRAAAAVVRTSGIDPHRVWWAADLDGALYYGLPASRRPEQGRVWVLMNPQPGELEARPWPALVVLSKPDIYDGSGALAAWLSQNRWRPTRSFQAFICYEPPRSSAP